jgi:hypothetical protein
VWLRGFLVHLECYVRQRNAGAHPLTVMTDPPQVVAPGEDIDFDEPLAGFESVEDNDSADEAEQPSGSAKTKSRKGKAAEAADDGGEVTQ